MIREATPADAAACAAIYAPYVTDTVISFETRPPSATEMQRRMRSAHLWLVTEAAGRVCGYAYASPHREREAYRWAADVAIYLDAGQRGRGLGRSLYTELIEGLRERGACVLCAGVALPNAASEALHRAMGFTEVGTYRRIAFKLDRWIDTRWYQLHLQPSLPTPPAHASLRLPADVCEDALLQELDHLLRRPGSRAVIAARAADAIRAQTPWRWVGIYTVSDGRVTNEAWSGPQPPAHPVFPATAGLTSAALATQKTVIADEVAAEPDYLANQDGTGSEMIVPVVIDERVVGTLDIESDIPRAFGESDRLQAERLAERLRGLWRPAVLDSQELSV
jgi:phosphinothricin acetyltransferase